MTFCTVFLKSFSINQNLIEVLVEMIHIACEIPINIYQKSKSHDLFSHEQTPHSNRTHLSSLGRSISSHIRSAWKKK